MKKHLRISSKSFKKKKKKWKNFNFKSEQITFLLSKKGFSFSDYKPEKKLKNGSTKTLYEQYPQYKRFCFDTEQSNICVKKKKKKKKKKKFFFFSALPVIFAILLLWLINSTNFSLYISIIMIILPMNCLSFPEAFLTVVILFLLLMLLPTWISS